jgi:beta-glucosidase
VGDRRMTSFRRAGWMGGCAAVLAACAPHPPSPPSPPPAAADRARPVPRVADTGAVDRAEEAFVDSVLARMTLPEKLGQLTQYAGQWGQTGPRVETATEDAIRRGQVGSFLSVWGADVTRRLQRIAVDESRLGIPILFSHDVIHGFRTLFPVPLAEAATWDPDVARE